MIPEAFLSRMAGLLDRDEFEAFSASLRSSRRYGLRVNTLKVNPADLKARVPFSLTPVPWAPEGFFYAEEDHPGKHVYHAAGLYYIQEPSAMAPVAVLDPQPGDWVLDLAAAPGGKSTQIAARLGGQGLVVANEIDPSRARALAENIDRLGVRNAVVTSESPEQLSSSWPGQFDRVLLDAPCSGEGMFRKDPDVCRLWHPGLGRICASRQDAIIAEAAKMVAPGGVLVYSTCTFNPEENEQVIARFLASNPSFEPVPVKGITGMVPARPDWGGGDSRVANAARLWPHVSDAEGHFVACLRNTDGGVRYRRRESGRGGEGSAAWQRFARETMAVPLPGRIVTQGAGVFLRPEGAIDVKGLRLVRPGWALGHLKDGDRFEPDQALAEGLRPEDAKRVVELSSRSEELQRFWGGQSLERQGQEGFTLVTVDGFPMGWGYSTGKRLKNYLARYARDPSPRA